MATVRGGNRSGISPIPSAWAAPNCDADGDGHLKNNRKCGGDDPDDSDPCNPDSEAVACPGGGSGTTPDYYNLARASFATRDELGSPDGSEEVLDVIERWLVVDFSDPSDPDSPSPCYDLDNGETGSELGIPLYLDTQIEKNELPCVDNLAIRLSADRILKAKANQQQLEFSIRWRPDPDASIYWSPWGSTSYIQPLFLRDPSDDPDDPFFGRNCRVMSTRATHESGHTRHEAELLREIGPAQTELLGTYWLPLEVCVERASD